ncbi:MAG: short-chain dehydrogenase/reductase [Bryobacterales bacterium]|nr:short-chain dehydrogenase/reductase [Bryobacterales bacterium]
MITGAGRGIGKRLAIGFAKAGAKVGLVGRNLRELESTHLEIEDAGGIALGLHADVCNFDEVSAAVGLLDREWGGVDVLIANAAVQGPVGPFIHNRPCDWAEVLNVNVQGVFNPCLAVLPQMVKRRSGKIVTISCDGATTPRAGFAVYSASKAAVARFVESLAEEVRDSNVQVNSMLPGGTYTSMTDEVLSAALRISDTELELATQIRLTGGMPAEKQLQLALFLSSERSNHVTGKLIRVQDDWKKLESDGLRPDVFTLRRTHR